MRIPMGGRRARADVWLFCAALALTGCITGGGGGSDDPDQGGGFGGFGGAQGNQDGGGLILDARVDAADLAVDAAVEVDACVPAGDEVCNGADDDCDGTADEGFDGVGDPCTVGEGACAAQGTLGCSEDGAGTVCDAVPGEPGVEACNEADDDCDGEVDENFRVGISCQFSEGECLSRGVEVCTADGTDTECDAEPIVIQEELCDGFDNDCDGLADEGIELGALCEAGEGLCRRGGFVECQDDGSVICTAQPGEPREEACNGFDDDCDGIADEDFGAELCEAGVGACRREGQTVCQEGGSLECNVVPGEPAMELCNGIDDDCDGESDEDFGGQAGGPCQNGEGVCARFGEFECAPGGFEVICNAEPAGEPARAEVCNGEDDDCDGTVDEDVEGVGVVCDEVEIGACQAAITACNDAGEVVCQAIDLEPGEEFCNGIDDDCDGTVDEDYPQLGEACGGGVGACAREGVFVCEQGAGGGVGGGANFEGIQQDLPEAQILAGGFEECWRGRFNEGQPSVAQILEQCGNDILMLGCRPAGQANLTLAAMGEREAILRDSGQERNPVNVHNGVNWYFSDRYSWGFGPVGEPLSRNSCDTGNTLPEQRMCWHTSNGNVSSGYRCGRTTLNGNAQWERIIYQRASGPGMVCSEQAGEPADEACNGADDDCDGLTDEGAEGTGLVCQEGVGLCERGETVCDEAGEIVCRAIPIEPSEELCNGIDDDCDGLVDNVAGAGEACDAGLGVCARPGVLACSEPGQGVQLLEGIQQNLDPAELERMGMRRCFVQGMGERGEPVADILEACQGEVMLMGCRDVGQPNLRVAAMGLREEVLTDTGNNNNRAAGGLHDHNGVSWYFNDSYSWGFVPGGEEVSRNSCDTFNREAEDRMCWHTSNRAMSSGYRCGSSTNSGALERVIWVADQLGGLVCEGAAADVAGDEVCNGLDDDCDGETDEGFGLNEPCEAGVGACRAEGVTVCNENGDPVCGADVPEPGVEACNGIDDDCDGNADEGLECPFFASCRAAQAAGNEESGIFPIVTDAGVQNFWCDMTTDGGGWTLVGSTLNQTMDDYGVPYYADLATLAPAQANPAIFNGFDFGPTADVRFACRDNVGAADAPMTVDLSFYDVPWYAEFAAAANDGASCFSEGNGAGDLDPPPARRNNVTNVALAQGDQWASGYLEGEDGCASNDDFTVDFDDRGMDSNQGDGTDWGEDDGTRKCGRNGIGQGQWFIFVRERPAP